MLKQRIISAVIAILLVIPFIYFGGTLYAVGVTCIAMAGFMEMLFLKKSHKEFPKVPLAIALCLLIVLILQDTFLYAFDYSKVVLLLLSLLIPIIFYKNEDYTSSDAFYLISIVLFLAMSFKSFIVVRESGIKTFLYLVSIPMATDSLAYFFGIKFGKHKMCPKISPKKSWEGAVAGLAFGTIIPCIIYFIAMHSFSFKIVVGTMILSTIGQFGDLIFSKIKRENGIKDFSNLMPGHGGALDRLDSTIVIFMTYILLTGLLF